jgi:hypothetical protein
MINAYVVVIDLGPVDRRAHIIVGLTTMIEAGYVIPDAAQIAI